jgi:hypothetical protein
MKTRKNIFVILLLLNFVAMSFASTNMTTVSASTQYSASVKLTGMELGWAGDFYLHQHLYISSGGQKTNLGWYRSGDTYDISYTTSKTLSHGSTITISLYKTVTFSSDELLLRIQVTFSGSTSNSWTSAKWTGDPGQTTTLSSGISVKVLYSGYVMIQDTELICSGGASSSLGAAPSNCYPSPTGTYTYYYNHFQISVKSSYYSTCGYLERLYGLC